MYRGCSYIEIDQSDNEQVNQYKKKKYNSTFEDLNLNEFFPT